MLGRSHLVTLPVLAVFLFMSGSADAGVVNFGSLGTFANSSDLDLTGTFAYAVNASGPAGYSVAGLTFTADTVAGCSVVAGNSANPWSTKPEYGLSADQNALGNLMYSIRWSNSPGTVNINLAVTPGTAYKLQLLFNENYWPDAGLRRTFDISVEGALGVDELEIRQVTGQWTQPQSHGAVYTYSYTAGDSVLNVVLSPGTTTPGDENPLINAFTLEQLPAAEPSGSGVPEPASLALVAFGAAGLFAVRRRR